MFVSCCVKCLVSVLVDSPNNVINFLFSNFYINEISTLHGPGVRLWGAILHPHSYWHFLPSFQNINGIQFICVSSSGWMWLAGEDIRPHLRCVSTVKWVWGPWPWPPVATTAPLFITGLGPGAGGSLPAQHRRWLLQTIITSWWFFLNFSPDDKMHIIVMHCVLRNFVIVSI